MLGQANAELGDAVAELRRIIEDLRPGSLDELGLTGALMGETRHLLHAAGVACESNLDPRWAEQPPLAAATEVAIYRIGLEAVTNVARHAGASRCCISLRLVDRDVVIAIEDDGDGLEGCADLGHRSRPTGIGISSMQQRAQELGGTLVFTTGRLGGTTVTARMPAVRS